MAPASLRLGRGSHESEGNTSECETAAPPLDLDLRLGPPGVVVASRSDDDVETVGLDLVPPSSNDLGKAAENGGNYVEQGADKDSNSGDADQPTMAPVLLLQVSDVVKKPVVVSASGEPAMTPAPDQEADEDEAAIMPRCKRARSEPAPLLVQPPRAPHAAAQHLDTKAAQTDNHNPHLPAVHQEDAGGVTEPTWVRADLLPRHGLPADLALHFVEDKVLTNSDVNPNQNRLLVTSAGSTRLRALLSFDELKACGLARSGNRRRKRPAAQGKKKKKRASPKKYPGVPVLVHERDDAGRGASALRLNTFHSTTAMVVNGAGYRDIIAANGFMKGDRVEVSAFRRPRDQQLCLVLAKRDDDRRPAIN